MDLKKKLIYLIILCSLFVGLILHETLLNHSEEFIVVEVISPIEFKLNNNQNIVLKEFETFDSFYSDKNAKLAKQLDISEDEAFILGNLGKYWAKNVIQSRSIRLKEDDLIYYKFSYGIRFENSPFCIKDGKPLNQEAFNRQLNAIRRGKYVILDLDSDMNYKVSKENAKITKNFVVVRKSHVKNYTNKQNRVIDSSSFIPQNLSYQTVHKSADFVIIVSDLTKKLIPDRSCSSDICKEILFNINNAKNSIDIAIYGYSSTPEVENALKNALNRGVKIRMVYDEDQKGNNIYPDTKQFTKLISENISDKNSAEVKNTMHNKFFVFDNSIVITGSANLSHTDMSGFNTNAIIRINSPKIANFYTQEFNQMYSNKFHNDKASVGVKAIDNMQIFFSPQDKTIKNGIIPIIKNAKSYIYVPAFVITEKEYTEELIKAKNRGVDVKIIVDALNASTKHSKHKELRAAGIPVKAENYAGKMHSKTMIIDDEYLIIGSMNFSNSGERRNDENVVVLKDSESAKFYKNFFLYQWNKIPNKWLKYTPRAEGVDSIGSCSDGLDNNYDGYTDKDDPACNVLLRKGTYML